MKPSRLARYAWVTLFSALTLGLVNASCSSPVLGGGAADGAIDGVSTHPVSCSGSAVACGGVCALTATDFDNCGACGKKCMPGEVCSGGACSLDCSGGATKCGTSCVDEQVDPANCGGCGKPCKAGEVCSKGACAESCGAGTSACGSSCVDEQVDPAHCGSCEHSCGVGVACSGGMCATTCAVGLTLCNGMTDGGKPDATVQSDGGGPGGCVDILTDPNNCNACGHACGSGHQCENGVCVLSCPTGEIDCGGLCIDPLTDDAHCGATGTCTADGGSAGKACTAGKRCNGSGVCEATCASPETLCAPDGGAAYCADLTNDTANCNKCGHKCSAADDCVSGACVSSTSSAASCSGSQTLCAPDGGGTYCADEQTDNANCGHCGNACPTGQTCVNAACVVACQSPATLCTAGSSDAGAWYCADLMTDDANCNACGSPCTGGATCVAGSCSPGSISCVAPQTVCSPGGGNPDYCADLQTDSDNCDGCGTVCFGVCVGGVCASQAAYDLTAASFSGSDTACDSGMYYDATPATITWTDTLPSGSTVIAAQLVLDWGVNCLVSEAGSATSTFNGDTFGPLVSQGACMCPPAGGLTGNALPIAPYLVGGANSVVYTPSVPVGWNPDANGSFGSILVQYTP